MGLNSALRVLAVGVSLRCASDDVCCENICQASGPPFGRASSRQRRADEGMGESTHEGRVNAGILVDRSAQKFMKQEMSSDALRNLRAIRRERRLKRKLMRRRRHRNCRKFKRRRVARGKGIRQRKWMRTRGFRRGRTRWRRRLGRRKEKAFSNEPLGDLERLIFSWCPSFPSDAAPPEEPRHAFAGGSLPSAGPTRARLRLRCRQRRRFGGCADNAEVVVCLPSRGPYQKHLGVGGDSESPPSVIFTGENSFREVSRRQESPKPGRQAWSMRATSHSPKHSDLPVPPGICPRKGIASIKGGFHDDRSQPMYAKIWDWIGTQLGKAFSSNDSGDGPESGEAQY